MRVIQRTLSSLQYLVLLSLPSKDQLTYEGLELQEYLQTVVIVAVSLLRACPHRKASQYLQQKRRPRVPNWASMDVQHLHKGPRSRDLGWNRGTHNSRAAYSQKKMITPVGVKRIFAHTCDPQPQADSPASCFNRLGCC